MKKNILLIILLCSSIFSVSQSVVSKKLFVEVSYNIELLGLAYFIGFEGVGIENSTVERNGKSVPKKEWHNYGYHFYERYKKHAASENLAKSFAVANHLWLDYLINLLLLVNDFPHAKFPEYIDVKYYIEFSLKKDTSEAKLNASIFLDGLNKFYNEIKFNEYINETKAYYQSAIRQVNASIPKKDFIMTLERFYKKQFNKYILFPSLTIPKGMGFGISYPNNKGVTITNVFGAFAEQTFQIPGKMDLGFGDRERMRELCIHEFQHSFVNPEVDKLAEGLILKTEPLFANLQSRMSEQNYITWKVCLYEHFVRAGEVIIAKLIGEEGSSRRLREEYIKSRNFIYLPVIIEELVQYNKGKISYNKALNNVMNKLLLVKETK